MRLRELLEAEVAAISSQAGALLCSACGVDRASSASPLVNENDVVVDASGTAEKLQKLPPARPCSSCGLREAAPRTATPPASSLASLALSQPFHAGQDPGPHRLSNVADTWQGSLDPEKYLDPFRHYGWTELCGQGGCLIVVWKQNCCWNFQDGWRAVLILATDGLICTCCPQVRGTDPRGASPPYRPASIRMKCRPRWPQSSKHNKEDEF